MKKNNQSFSPDSVAGSSNSQGIPPQTPPASDWDATRRQSSSAANPYLPPVEQTRRQDTVRPTTAIPKAAPPPPPVSHNQASLPPEMEVISKDFHKRLRGKPTHATRPRKWYLTIGSVLFSAFKFFLVILLLAAFIIGGFGGGMLVAYVSTAEPLTNYDLKNSVKNETSFVYDSAGNEIAKLTGAENIDSIYIPYSQVKDTYLAAAITSIEDERFYTHNGIDIQRIGSAVLSALGNSGNATHGGSTITQQTVKMISGQDQRSTQRKIQEWFSAMALEKELTKDEIMELYINTAPMGNNYIGVQSAALNYFGKDAKDLTLLECAFLAGIPKSPSYYNPLRESGKRNAMRRMRVVLSKMKELGKITEEQYQEALNSELIFKVKPKTAVNTVNSYFVDYAIQEVINDLKEQKGIKPDMAAKLVYSGGYRIYTTLEAGPQSALDATFMNQELFQKDPAAWEDKPEKPEAGMAVINNQTGAIAALQGGYGEKESNMILNRATAAYRQPGSSIKPLVDYAPAFEIGKITAASVFNDTVRHFNPSDPGEDWPKNADKSYWGYMTIRKAIAESRNTIATEVLLEETGIKTGLSFLQQVGIDRMTEEYPSVSIGAFNVGMSPLQMASAYATFTNNGVYRQPYSYTKVTDSDGNVILEKEIVSRQVYSDSTAFIMSDILKDTIEYGTASGTVDQLATDSGEHIDLAGKTGTTDDNKDKWFVGFSPYYSSAVWYGLDNRLTPDNIIPVDRSNAMRIWNDAMQNIHKGLAGAAFLKPDSVEELTICIDTGKLASDSCTNLRSEYFAVGTEPDYCPGHAPVETAPPETAPAEEAPPVEENVPPAEEAPPAA